MRRVTWIVAIVMCVSLFLTGCGKKDAEGVVKDLNHVIGDLQSYQGAGTMTLHTGQQPQEYDLEVWYKNPHYYRIALSNAKQDITQIVLRNDDGVFVLTPNLNKSFRFQSDWPEKQGQVYLFQTLANSIVADQDRQFVAEDKAYVFDVAANYQNSSLARQKIWLNKKDYAPKRVEVFDADANKMVEVKFDQFAFGKKFDADAFDMKRNMVSFSTSSSSTPEGESEDVSGDQEQPLQNMAGETKELQNFGVVLPTYMPEGVTQKDMKDLKLGEERGVILRYSGDYNYSITEVRPMDRAVSAEKGTIVDLGYTFGALIGDELKTLAWVHQGVEFRLTSGDLPVDEMIQVAQSVQGQIGK